MDPKKRNFFYPQVYAILYISFSEIPRFISQTQYGLSILGSLTMSSNKKTLLQMAPDSEIEVLLGSWPITGKKKKSKFLSYVN